ncbi:MAG: hypothetical protein JSR67_00350 [Proteobacteria bacterium]|nr:hypothetical protein [Pseudomonadota bacterium]
MSKYRSVLITAAATIALGAVSATALAGDHDTRWQKHHPRREQVNNRLANQNRRIHQEVKEGEMSRAQAATLHRDDHAIRQEERTMARTNGGHVTRAEQRALNQQENQVSKQIGR